jgi:transposase
MRTNLVPLDGDPTSTRGGVSSRTIFQLYSEYLPQLLRPGDIFMHDGASMHRAHIIGGLLHDLGVNVMIWPPYSPDLNLIENLWALMKAEIYRLYPHLEHAPDTGETLEALVRAAVEAWGNIDLCILKNLSDTMPHRVQAVIEAKGWYTKY